MDDFNINSLQESKNEWVSRLVNILAPHITDGFRQIYTESFKLCIENDEEDKYLMTFQNFVARIPKWNNDIIDEEVKRIVEKSNCGYIEDLITCVHVVQLKALTCVRVGQKQKKIDINIPQLKDFIHKVYIQSARKIYTNIYLFEKDIAPLQKQKNNREIELLVKESILNAVRESIPVEQILRSYLEETVEEEIKEEYIEEVKQLDDKKETDEIKVESVKEDKDDKDEKEEIIVKKNETKPELETEISKETEKKKEDNLEDKLKLEIKEEKSAENKGISFSDVDNVIDSNKNESTIEAPKTIEALEEISEQRTEDRKLQELLDNRNEGLDEKISILEEPITLNTDVLEPLDTEELLGDVESLS
tara:strand:- start:2544 stop:3632 length:1089 start_codon:yes stop_codon:yes gene_type:complete